MLRGLGRGIRTRPSEAVGAVGDARIEISPQLPSDHILRQSSDGMKLFALTGNVQSSTVSKDITDSSVHLTTAVSVVTVEKAAELMPSLSIKLRDVINGDGYLKDVNDSEVRKSPESTLSISPESAPPSKSSVSRAKIPKRTPTEQLLSQIDGHLYLSGMFPVRETPETLRALGIKHILTLRREPVPKFRQLTEITYKFIAVDDTRNQDMLGNDLLENCLRFLHNTIEVRKESTLVHCEMGMSRSAMVVIAFLMRKYRMTVNDALAMVRACRDIVQPNVSFMTQLNIFAEMNYSATFFALSRCETYHEWCVQTKNVCLRSDTFEHTVAKVEEGLYVGSRADATMRRSYLRHVGITHLLTVSSEHIEIDEAFDGLRHKFVYLHEHRREDILGGGILDHCTRFISAAIEVGGKVLVHCDGSFNRCLPIAAAYLIRHQNWDMVKVKNLLREHYTFGSESPDSKEGLILQLSFLVKLKGRTDDESLRSFLPYLCWLTQSGNTVRFKSLMGGVEPNVRYNCLVCGCLLFRDNHIIRHYRSMDGKMCGMRYQINAPDWIVRENDIAFCPECGVDIGNFCPLGYECRMIGCGRVVPSCLNIHEVCVAISSISS